MHDFRFIERHSELNSILFLPHKVPQTSNTRSAQAPADMLPNIRNCIKVNDRHPKYTRFDSNFIARNWVKHYLYGAGTTRGSRGDRRLHRALTLHCVEAIDISGNWAREKMHQPAHQAESARSDRDSSCGHSNKCELRYFGDQNASHFVAFFFTSFI